MTHTLLAALDVVTTHDSHRTLSIASIKSMDDSFAPVTTPNRSPPLKKWNDGTSRTPWLAISCLVSSELSPITWSNKATVR